MNGDTLPDVPRFARHFSVHRVGGEGVVLHSERRSHILTGALNERIAELLDGERSTDDVVDALSDEFPMAEIYFALMSLAQDGFLVDASEKLEADDAPATAAFWDSLDELESTTCSTGSDTIVVTATPSEDAQRWRTALAAHGFAVADRGRLTLVLTSDYLDPTLHAFNRRAREEKRAWLLVRAVGPELWIGPLFIPDASPCWECLRPRLESNAPIYTFLANATGEPPGTPRSDAAWTQSAAVGLVATQLARILRREDARELAGVLTRVDTVTLATTHHRVARRPQCPVCGDAQLMTQHSGTAIELQSQPKRFTADGGHRTVTPDETIAKLAPLIDPVAGVVSELRRVPYDSANIHVYTAGRNAANGYRDLTGLRNGLRRSSSGKGFTDAQARASALGEAIERHSAGYQGDEPRIHATFTELGDAAVHPSRCLHYSDAQYAAPAFPANAGVRDDWVPAPFDEHAWIDWSPIWSLTGQRTKYLPTALLYLGYPVGAQPFGLADSNGNAAGNTIEEAVLQGFLELIERDSTAMWWYNRTQRPAVDVESLELPGWDTIREYYREIDRDIWLLDITADFGIPVFVAVSRERSGEREDLLLGLGAHLDPQIAASRAISEMNQMLSALAALREDATVNHTLAHWLEHATVANQSYLAPAPGRLSHRRDFVAVSHADLRDDVLWCQQQIAARGMELLVLDQTRPDVALPVVKVVVPDLRHFRPRFAAGRLYDVPVSMGWVSQPRQESELNPIPFFL